MIDISRVCSGFYLVKNRSWMLRMFELEVSHVTYTKDKLSSDFQKSFENNSSNYAAVSILQWEEHCTECAMPECYQTCDLYESRKDGKCRRFTEGIAPIKGFANYQDNLVKITFKKWGSLMATGYLDIVDLNKAMTVERKAVKVAAIAASIPDSRISIMGRRGVSSRLTTRYKKRMLKNFLAKEKICIKPDYFLLEIYNPNDYHVDLTFVIRATEGEKSAIPYQKRLELDHGFHKITIDYKEIHNFVDPDKKHYVSLIPNFEDAKETTIPVYFGFLGLIKENEYSTSDKIKAIKVVAWDLDNTVWEGVLVEDGEEKLKLMPNIKTVMESLDKRGIVNSVVSKNNHVDAFEQLKKFGLEDLIVFPKISWNPKSHSINAMINEFNIGADSVAFIDDSLFERKEVKTAIPSIRVFDARDYMDILDYPEFNPVQSTESSKRRVFYKNQKKRIIAQEEFPDDYLVFLKSCAIKLSIFRANSDSADRVQELVQRTNQLNFSGNRYQREEIERLLSDSALDCYCIKCEDKFGDYGTVGFCVVKNKIPQIIDLMFSCRIQSKRIEHAFISWLLHKYRGAGFTRLTATYNKTQKNTPAGKVFDDLGFIEKINDNGPSLYEFELPKNIPWDGLVAIEYEGEKWEP